MDMEFQVGQSVTFGFDVGGGYIPPEPETSTPFISGTMTPVFQGSLVNLSAGEVISGIAELEE